MRQIRKRSLPHTKHQDLCPESTGRSRATPLTLRLVPFCSLSKLSAPGLNTAFHLRHFSARQVRNDPAESVRVCIPSSGSFKSVHSLFPFGEKKYKIQGTYLNKTKSISKLLKSREKVVSLTNPDLNNFTLLKYKFSLFNVYYT